MEKWFINAWKAKNREFGYDLFAIKIWNIEVFGIWVSKWAIDITIMKFTAGIGITGNQND